MTNTQETLSAMKQALSTPSLELGKAWAQSGSATSGMTAYPLDPAKTIYPVLTPLRNRIPRVSGASGIQASWRAITGINTTNISAGVGDSTSGAADFPKPATSAVSR